MTRLDVTPPTLGGSVSIRLRNSSPNCFKGLWSGGPRARLYQASPSVAASSRRRPGKSVGCVGQVLASFRQTPPKVGGVTIKNLLWCLLVFIPLPLLASNVITKIDVRGNQRVEGAAILATIESRVGMTYTSERVRQDIQNLYRMGAFSDVRVEKGAAAGGVQLTFAVEERSSVTKVSFQGNKKVKEDKLRELMEVKEGSVDQAKLARSIEKIKDHYAEKGYHLAEIFPEFKKISEGEEELIFHIHEHEQVKVKRINFIGNHAFSDRALRHILKTKERGWFSWASQGGKYQEELIKRDLAFLVFYYQNHGYLKVKVTPPKVYLTRDKKWLQLTFHITEGVPYTLQSVGVDGDVLTTKEELVSKLTMHEGELYSRQKMEEDIMLLSKIYGDQGYAFANIDPLIKTDDEKRTANITLHIQKGNKITIERVNIFGNTVTRDKVIRREILVREMSLYNETKLQASRERLMQLGFFEEVNFATPRGSTDDSIVLNITVKEKPTGTFSIGAGFSSSENFIFTASVAKDNFFGFGISGQLSMELSSKRQLFLLQFEDPHFFDSDWILGVSGFRSVNEYTDFSRRSFGGSLTLGHRIFERTIARFIYGIEDVDVGDFSTAIPVIFNQNLKGLTSSETFSLQRDTRDNRLFPTRGDLESFSVEYAGLGGDNNYLRMIGNLRFYHPLWKKVVARLNVQVGHIQSLNNLPVPLFERFFLGGVNSLRGYGLRAVGPSVQMPSTPAGGDNQFVFGGNKMLQFNLEFEVPIYEPAGFKFVTFLDSGNTFSEEQNYSLKSLRSDYGFGLRWHSPFGPLRFEWGFPIKKRPDEDVTVFNFTIGSFF